MKCPVDRKDMIVVEHKKIELDFCLECSGVWLDSGELELLTGILNAEGAGLSHTEMLTPRMADVDEAKRKCTICGRKMDKVWLGKAPEVLVDSCPLGHGMWFDGGELQKVLSEMCTASGPEVVCFLQDAFPAAYWQIAKK